ncbi:MULTISPECIES: hypothetical protein [Brasilonema]|jgi:hypothetical protein|nr:MULTISPECIES: hypothetical protein [Brasilonema]
MATGVPGALSMLFNVLPDVIGEVSGLDRLTEQQRASYKTLFDKAY